MLSIFNKCDKIFSQVWKKFFTGVENFSHWCKKSPFICAKIKIVLQPSKRTPTFARPTTTLFIPSPQIGIISITNERKKNAISSVFSVVAEEKLCFIRSLLLSLHLETFIY